MPFELATQTQLPLGTEQFMSRDPARLVGMTANQLPRFSSRSDAQTFVDSMRTQGFPATVSRPLLVYRTDIGQVETYDGNTWATITPGISAKAQTTFVAQYSRSTLSLSRVGNLVYFGGVITSTAGTIQAGYYTDIGVIPGGWRPSAAVYGGGFVTSLARFVNGATPPFYADSTMWIHTATGNVNVRVQAASSDLRVSAQWII